ncbi:MAG: DUF2391 family protein [Candidatus Woesearchaeota archaeon]
MTTKLNSKLQEQNNDLNKVTLKLEELDKKQNQILILQKKLLKKEEEILLFEEKIYDAEQKNLKLNKKFDKTKFPKLTNCKKKALTKVTYKDVFKAIIGAFFGIMGHFAFAKGVDIAHNYSYLRSSILFLTSFIVLIIFIYYTGFREVKPHFFLRLFPARASVIYISAIITVVVVLFLYDIINLNTPFNIIYNYVAAVSILAVLGAGTSDLIGGE